MPQGLERPGWLGAVAGGLDDHRGRHAGHLRHGLVICWGDLKVYRPFGDVFRSILGFRLFVGGLFCLRSTLDSSMDMGSERE